MKTWIMNRGMDLAALGALAYDGFRLAYGHSLNTWEQLVVIGALTIWVLMCGAYRRIVHRQAETIDSLLATAARARETMDAGRLALEDARVALAADLQARGRRWP